MPRSSSLPPSASATSTDHGHAAADPGTGRITITALAGSLRRDSYNRALIRSAKPPQGVVFTVWDGLATIPPFDEDLEARGWPPAVEAFAEVVRRSDGLLIVTPEYNGSVPGQLKNALDWVSRPDGSAPLLGALVATASVSVNRHGAVWAQEELRKVLSRSGATVVGDEFVVPEAYRRFSTAGVLTDAQVEDRLAQVIDTLAASAAARRASPIAEAGAS